MAGRPEAPNPQYFQLLQRVAFNANATVAIAANGTTGTAAAAQFLVPIPQGQAIRIAFLQASCADPGSTGKLTLQDASVFISDQSGAGETITSLAFPCQGVVLANNGITFSKSWDELIFWNDDQEFGGVPPGLQFEFAADVTNTDTVNPHNLSTNVYAIIEFFLLTNQQLVVTGHVD